MSDQPRPENKKSRKGLGVAPYCLPEKALADPVDHGELQAELQRLRAAIGLLANCMGAHIISQESARRLNELLQPPYERVRR
jgi:hypothetical protein